MAEAYFLRSLSVAEKKKDVRYVLDNIENLSDIYLRRKRLKEAHQYLTRSEKLIAKGKSFKVELAKIYRRQAELYTKLGDHGLASEYQRKYIQLKDSIYDIELTNRLIKLEADYLECENKVRLAAQEEVLALNNKIIDNQRLTNIISITLSIVVLPFAGVLFRQYSRKKRDNTRLDQRVRERTQLESNREALLKALEERDFILGQINAEVRDALSRFRGLTSLCTTEVADPMARQYFGEFTKAAEDLSANLGGYFLHEQTSTFNNERPPYRILKFMLCKQEFRG